MNNQLQTLLLAAFPDAYIGSFTSTDWSSLYFAGEAHQVCLMFEDEPAAAVAYANILNDRVDVNLDEVAGMYVVEYDEIEDDGLTAVVIHVVTLNT